MRTREDLICRVRLELIHWRPIQAREPGTPFYLWHIPHSPESACGILIARKRPRGHMRAYPHPLELRLNVEQNLERLVTSGCLDD
ncbi:MAG: hypothetical protein HS116_21210 [Planctomycetes bacterium]|nr:hypothetical protein [Planctomycetota bacterium]